MNKRILLVSHAALLWGCSAEADKELRPSRAAEISQVTQAYSSSRDRGRHEGKKHGKRNREDVLKLKLQVATQGPFWPPSEVADEDGNFVLLGINIIESAPGVISIVPNTAAIVSKDTVPPLAADGTPIPHLNWFGAPYSIVRNLDLSSGSADQDLVLYSLSAGPGGFDGAPRVPAEGSSAYNLNGLPETCPELATPTQRETYVRPSFPLHEVPIWGFQGDQIGYDAETGNIFDPTTATGEGCPFTGCPGEDEISVRRTAPITLGDWLRGKGDVRIELINFDETQDAYTHAKIDLAFEDLIPEGIYTVWAIRPRNAPSLVQTPRLVQPLGIPNAFRTDRDGAGTISFIVKNPFPDPTTDTFGRRIAGLNILFHPDAQNWGACFSRFGPGTDGSAHLSTFVDGTLDFTDFVTREPL